MIKSAHLQISKLNNRQNVAFTHDQESSPSIEISVPAYLPYKTVSPSFTVTGSSFLPGPAAITIHVVVFLLQYPG